MQDPAATERAKSRAAAYLKLPKTRLETKLPFVENAMLLDEIFTDPEVGDLVRLLDGARKSRPSETAGIKQQSNG